MNGFLTSKWVAGFLTEMNQSLFSSCKSCDASIVKSCLQQKRSCVQLQRVMCSHCIASRLEKPILPAWFFFSLDQLEQKVSLCSLQKIQANVLTPRFIANRCKVILIEPSFYSFQMTFRQIFFRPRRFIHNKLNLLRRGSLENNTLQN